MPFSGLFEEHFRFGFQVERLKFTTKKIFAEDPPAIRFGRRLAESQDVYSGILLTSSFAFCFDLFSVHVFGQSISVRICSGRGTHSSLEERERRTSVDLKLVDRNTFLL